jgi:hypothetical protein
MWFFFGKRSLVRQLLSFSSDAYALENVSYALLYNSLQPEDQMLHITWVVVQLGIKSPITTDCDGTVHDIFRSQYIAICLCLCFICWTPLGHDAMNYAYRSWTEANFHSPVSGGTY